MKFKTTTFEEACKATGRSTVLPDVSMLLDKDRQHIIDNYKLDVAIEAINQEANGGEPWNPNYNDSSEQKWEPLWFNVEASEEQPAGFALSGTRTLYAAALTHVGARRCYRTREALLYGLKQFADLYKSTILKQS